MGRLPHQIDLNLAMLRVTSLTALIHQADVLHVHTQVLELIRCSVWPHAALLELRTLGKLSKLELYKMKTPGSMALMAAVAELCTGPGNLAALQTLTVAPVLEGEAMQAIQAVLAAGGRADVRVTWR